MTAPDDKLKLRLLAERIETLENMTSPAGEHGNSSHAPDFLPESGYSRGDIMVAPASGLLAPIAVGASRGYWRSDGTDPLWTATMPFNIGASSTLNIVSGLVAVTQTQHDLNAEGAPAPDDLIGATGGVAGDWLLLQLSAADEITIKYADGGAPAGSKFLLWGDQDVTLVKGTDRILFVKITFGFWLEVSRTIKAWPAHSDTSGRTADDHHTQSHGSADHSGKIGEAPWGPLRIPLTKALPAATNNASLDDDWVYKSPWTNEAVRISRWYIRFESNLAVEAKFELRKNGTVITGSEITVSAAARDAAIDSFTETTLADGDSLEVWQTAGNAEDIGGSAYVYGDQDVVGAVTY